jgi:hypothetical protein
MEETTLGDKVVKEMDADPSKTYIIKDGKCYRVPKNKITPRKDICTNYKLWHYLGGSLGLPIESLPEVK